MELAAVVVEILYLKRMQPFGESLLADDFAGAVGAVVVNHGCAVNQQQAAVVAQEGEGVDAVGGMLI